MSDDSKSVEVKPTAGKPATTPEIAQAAQGVVNAMQQSTNEQTEQVRAALKPATNPMGLPSWAWLVSQFGAMGILIGLHLWTTMIHEPALQTHYDSQLDAIRAENTRQIEALEKVAQDNNATLIRIETRLKTKEQ